MENRVVEKFALSGSARGSGRGAIHVGLVNNMPDATLRATELQFARLLKDASEAQGAQPLDVRLHLFSLPQIRRGDAVLARMAGFYADAALLPAAGLDALIVTEAEPRADDLRDEPHWNALARVMDWAESGVISTYYSGLAAHAAVLHRDGIACRKLTRKLSGVFAVRPAAEDALLAGMPARAEVPHSRRHDLVEETLAAKNYRILTRLADGGIDLFLRRGRNLQLYSQGHPEYDSATPGRDYLHALGRHLEGEGERPGVPEHYFDRVTEDRLAELDSTAPDNLAQYTDVVTGAVPLVSWRGHTVRLFANWLAGIAGEKIRRSAGRAQFSRPRKQA
jgi:homoserine O-succinyltransferase